MTVGWASLLGTYALALLLWMAVFALGGPSFWLKISLSAVVLAGTASRFDRGWRDLYRPRWSHLGVGIASAFGLYAIFYLGRQLSTVVLPFAQSEIGMVYRIRSQLDPVVITVLLVLVLAPAEEFYWRGFVQRKLMSQWGNTVGWLVTAAGYALVHIWALNFMLMAAALVAGLCWGFLFSRQGSLVPVTISHALWDVLIFVLWPLG